MQEVYKVFLTHMSKGGAQKVMPQFFDKDK